MSCSGLWRQALAAAVSDGAVPATHPVPAPEVTSQSRLSRKECGAASASPVHSPAPYSQPTLISSFSQGARLCTEHVHSATRAGALLP